MIDAVSDENHLVWIDIETSGLDPHKDKILEIGVLITNLQLRYVAKKYTVINWGDKTDEIYDNSNEFVQNMHTKNHLWQDCRTKGIEIDKAELVLAEWANEHSVKNQFLCGNSLKLDREFVGAQMPLFHDIFHYRSLDVSTFKVAASRYNKRVFEEMKKETSRLPETHRVKDCLNASLVEFGLYLDKFLLGG